MNVEDRLLQLERHVAAQDRRLIGQERQLRRYRLVLALGGLAVVVAACAGTLQGKDAIVSKDAVFNTVTARRVIVKNKTGQVIAGLYDNRSGGYLGIFNNTGQVVTELFASKNGGNWAILNRTNEDIVNAYADEDGNGVVGAYSRKGEGRTLKPGP